MLDLNEYKKNILEQIKSFPQLSQYWLGNLLAEGRDELPKEREEGEYKFIPISGQSFLYVILFVNLYNEAYFKANHKQKYLKFIDLGAGNGQTRIVSLLSNPYINYIGIEKYPLKKYNKQVIKKGDFLKKSTFNDLGNFGKIYYAYNPLKDNEMMYDALGFWITEILEKGDILIYIKTSFFEAEYEKIFQSQFKNLFNSIYIYEKE